MHSISHSHSRAPETQGRLIRWANRYDRTVKFMSLGMDGALRQKTADVAQIRPGDSVLDVGCGTGDLTIVTKTRAGSTGAVYGIDASPEMIETARAKVAKKGIEIEFRVEPIEALSFEDASFDVVTSSLMMHHLPDDLKQKGLAEIYRVLKPGGHLLIVDFKRPTALHTRAVLAMALHHRRMDTGAQELPVMMQAAGFKRIETQDTLLGLLGFVRGER